MRKEFHRTDRVADMLRVELATLLRYEANDPRFAQLTVVEVRVTRDLSHAKVFVSMLEESQEEQASVAKALQKATGFIRSQVAKRTQLRIVPTLAFIIDNTFDQGKHLTSLIESAMSDDRSQAFKADDDSSQ